MKGKPSTKAMRDLAAIVVVAAIGFVVAFYFDVFEEFQRWAQRYERWQIDELVVVPLVFGLAFGFYSWRRWQELKVETSRREEAQNALEESEQRFRSLVQNAKDIVMLMNADGTVGYLNPAVEEMLGYKPEDIVGTNSFTPIHPDDDARVQGIFANAMSNPGVTSWMELRLQHADGSWRHIETYCTSLLHDPTVRGVIVNSRDVTERKRAEKKLQESEASLAQAQRIACLGSWEYEPENNRVYWSDETYRVFGFTPQQFVPTFENFLDSVYPDDRVVVRENTAELLCGEQSQDVFEFRIVRPDGEVRLVKGRRRMEHNETSGLIKMVGTVQDITERKRAEDALRKSEARHRAILEATPDLIASVATGSTWTFKPATKAC